jgi:hypothetical protein
VAVIEAPQAGVGERALSIRPLSGLLAVALLFGVLQAAPLISTINGYAGANIAAPLITIWFLGVAVSRGRHRAQGAPLLAAALGLVGLLGAFSGLALNPLKVWWLVLLAPLMIFVGLQWVDDRGLLAARRALRAVLIVAAALQCLFYFQAAGARMLSAEFNFAHHTDIDWWKQVGGHVLANPNNASVIFCAGFGWAIAEVVMGRRGPTTILFVVVTALSAWVTASRGAIITVVLLTLLAVGLHRGSRWLLAVVGAGVVYVLSQSVNWGQDLSFATNNATESVRYRENARLAAIPEVLEHPFGSGVGSVATALHGRLFAVFLFNDYEGATSHDLFLNWGVAAGWVGLVLLLVALFVAFRRSIRVSGWLPLLPLMGFIIGGESAGVDVLTTNPAWSVVLWGLTGLAWRGRIVGMETPARRESHSHPRATGAHDGLHRR